MFKAVCLLKRRQGMSFDEFVDYYETNHRLLGEKWLPTVKSYVRRYLRPVANPVTGEAPELDYDVITEMWFETREAFEAAMAGLCDPGALREISEDEEKLFDRSRICLCTVEEYASQLG